MRPDPELCFSLNLDRTSRAGEGLLVYMAVSQNTPVHQVAVSIDHLPPVGVLLAAQIRTADFYREGVCARAAAHFYGQDISDRSLSGCWLWQDRCFLFRRLRRRCLHAAGQKGDC